MVTEVDVRRIALSFPGAYEQDSYGGRPSWRTKPRIFTWIRDEPDAVVVWVESLAEKEALVASDLDKFFTTPHYDGHPVVLVRLSAVDVEEVAELIGDSWRLRAPRSLTKGWNGDRERDVP
ncbi:MAG: MmcQ/YjbR family DNA-binding protein [Actinomycetota bacterium]|nr:MmcQ/YjbR family DNA-binding protein [Actinomycetota bacterium]